MTDPAPYLAMSNADLLDLLDGTLTTLHRPKAAPPMSDLEATIREHRFLARRVWRLIDNLEDTWHHQELREWTRVAEDALGIARPDLRGRA